MSRYGQSRYFLPKKCFSTVPPALPEDEYFSMITEISKTIELHIEDFLERLNDVQRVRDDFITSPRIFIGHQLDVFVSIYVDVNNDVRLYPFSRDCDQLNPKFIKVTGYCGNLAFDNENCAGAWSRCDVKLGSRDELKEAMTTSGNNKMDLQVTLTEQGIKDIGSDGPSEWIITR